jgi:molecular chaperone GrpE
MTFEKKMPTMDIKIEKHDEQSDEKENSNTEDAEDTGEQNENEVNNEYAKKIEELTEKNKNLEEKLLYLAAELQNTKKRNAIDLENANKFAINKFAIDAIGIFDILQTAFMNVNQENTDQVLYNGLKATIDEFKKMFNRTQISVIKPEIGSVFDHNKHEAISRVKSELEAGCIVEVVRDGYELYGRLLRPAMVVVSGGE